jgi:hypothetical protein
LVPSDCLGSGHVHRIIKSPFPSCADRVEAKIGTRPFERFDPGPHALGQRSRRIGVRSTKDGTESASASQTQEVTGTDEQGCTIRRSS